MIYYLFGPSSKRFGDMHPLLAVTASIATKRGAQGWHAPNACCHRNQGGAPTFLHYPTAKEYAKTKRLIPRCVPPAEMTTISAKNRKDKMYNTYHAGLKNVSGNARPNKKKKKVICLKPCQREPMLASLHYARNAQSDAFGINASPAAKKKTVGAESNQ